MADRKMHTREYKLEVLELARTSGKTSAVIEQELLHDRRYLSEHNGQSLKLSVCLCGADTYN